MLYYRGFALCTGALLLQGVLRKKTDTVHKLSVNFATYSTGSWTEPLLDKSGAYTFIPNGPAQVRASIGASLVTYFSHVLLLLCMLGWPEFGGDEVCFVTRAANWRFQVCGCHGNGPCVVISNNTSAHDSAQSGVDQFHRFVNLMRNSCIHY